MSLKDDIKEGTKKFKKEFDATEKDARHQFQEDKSQVKEGFKEGKEEARQERAEEERKENEGPSLKEQASSTFQQFKADTAQKLEEWSKAAGDTVKPGDDTDSSTRQSVGEGIENAGSSAAENIRPAGENADDGGEL